MSFTIKDGILERYTEEAGVTEAVIPDTVTRIGERAFKDCTTLTSVVIPETVTSIGNCAFKNCASLTAVVIPDSVTSIEIEAFCGCKSLTSVVIPDSVTEVGRDAFAYCKSLTSVVIPDSVTEVGRDAFAYCESLTSVTVGKGVKRLHGGVFYACPLQALVIRSDAQLIGDSLFGDDFGGGGLPKSLYGQLETLSQNMTYHAVIKYLVRDWQNRSASFMAKLFLERQSKPVLKEYANFSDEYLTDMGRELQKQLEGSPLTAAQCKACAAYIELFCHRTDTDILRALYALIESSKAGKKTLEALKAQTQLLEQLGISAKPKSKTKAKKDTLEQRIRESVSEASVWMNLKNFYTLKPADLPVLKSAAGKKLDPLVLAYLLTVHEKPSEDAGSTELVAAYEAPGICPEAEVMLAEVDAESFRKALQALAKTCKLGNNSFYRKNWMAFPVCRYADEALMQSLTATYTRLGPHAMVMGVFRKAVLYSNTEAALLFTMRYQDDFRYARLRFSASDAADGAVPAGETAVKAWAFAGNRNLQTVTIPDSVTRIGTGAFYGCTGLTAAVLPQGTERVDDCAFYDCAGLKALTLPETVTHIGDSAFAGCTGLRAVKLRPDDPALQRDYSSVKKLGAALTAALDMLRTGNYSADVPTAVKYPFTLLHYLHTHDEAAAAFIKKSFSRIAKESIENGDVTVIGALTDSTEFITKQNVDKLLQIAQESKQHEIFVLLLNYKNEHIGFADPGKKFRL